MKTEQEIKEKRDEFIDKNKGGLSSYQLGQYEALNWVLRPPEPPQPIKVTIVGGTEQARAEVQKSIEEVIKKLNNLNT